MFPEPLCIKVRNLLPRTLFFWVGGAKKLVDKIVPQNKRVKDAPVSRGIPPALGLGAAEG